MANNRDDFSLATKELLANRVGRRCSNPKCQKLTCAANTDPDKITNIGVAAIFVPQQRVVQDMMKYDTRRTKVF